jgi:hypothetical protein
MKRSFTAILLLSLSIVCHTATSQTSTQGRPLISPASASGQVDETDTGAPQSSQYAQALEAQVEAAAASRNAQQQRQKQTPHDWGHGRSYFPNTAHLEKQPDAAVQAPCVNHSGKISNALHSINPDDVNYGGLFSIWHLHFVENTLLSALWWGLVGAGTLIIILCLYIFWLNRQRDERYRLTVDIMLQSVNAHRFARFHAHRVIAKYNLLVDGMNAEYESDMRDTGSPLSLSGSSAIAMSRAAVTPPLTMIAPIGDITEMVRGFAAVAPPAIATAQYGMREPAFASSERATDDVLATANAAAAQESVQVKPAEDGIDKDKEIRKLREQLTATSQKLSNTRKALRRQRSSIDTITTGAMPDDDEDDDGAEDGGVDA